MISYKLFLSLFEKAKGKDVEEFSSNNYMPLPADKAQWLLRSIWSVANDQTIKNIAATCGLSVRRLAITLGVSTHTVENWSSGMRTPTDSVLRMFVFAALSNTMEELFQ